MAGNRVERGCPGDVEVILGGRRLGRLRATPEGEFEAIEPDGSSIGVFSTDERAVEELEWWDDWGVA